MTNRGPRFYALPALALLVSSTSLAPSPRADIVCGQFQSCVPATPQFSAKPAAAPAMSFKIVSGELDIRTCTAASLSKDVEKTIAKCEAFVKAGGGTARDRASAMFMLGHAYMRTALAFSGSADSAENRSIEMWNQAAAADPAYVEPLLSIGRMYGLSGQPIKSLEVLGKAEKLAPDDWRVYVYKIEAFSHMNNSAARLEQVEKAMKLNAQEPQVRRAYGAALLINSRLEEAAQQYLVAAEAYDAEKDTSLEFLRDENAWITLAGIYAKLGKPAMAAAAITKYIDSTKELGIHYTLLQQRSEYYEQAKMYGEAAEDLKAAAASAPPPFIQALNDKRTFLLAKAGAKEPLGDDLYYKLEHGSLKSRLKVQVFLRNQGYARVTINGRYDDATKEAVDACLQDKSCAPGIGRAI